MIVSLGQYSTMPVDAPRYADAALAIGEKYYALNVLSGNPSAISADVPLSQIMDMWGTHQGREARINFYLRSIAIRTRQAGRGSTYQASVLDYSDNDYAGIVIGEIQRKLPQIDVAAVITTGNVALELLSWSQGNLRDMPRAFVCDVILSMNGYFGLPEQLAPVLPEPEDGAPAADRGEDDDKGKMPEWLLPVGIAVLLGLALARRR